MSSVVVEAGQPCNECGTPVDSQDDNPVVFFVEELGKDEVWHGDCLPIDLQAQLIVASI